VFEIPDRERERRRFDTIVAIPRRQDPRPRAAGAEGYREVNLRPCGATGGSLLTASCSFHVSRELPSAREAAADSGRLLVITETSVRVDHPEIITIPETGYLKGRC
jgi:23S rRNA (cytosine1962-C5)-methyltransferase